MINDVNVIMFLSGQLITLLMAIGASYIKTREQLIELRTRLTSLEVHYENGIANLRHDHSALSDRVDGISRAVARLEGQFSHPQSHSGS